MTSKATAQKKEPRVGRQTIVLSDFDLLDVSFVNKQGRELLSVDFDRIADSKPQLTVRTLDAEGNLQSANTLFDLDT